MDNAALEALFSQNNPQEAHQKWLKIVTEAGFPEEMVEAQLYHVEEILRDDAFYFTIEELLKPHQDRYPNIYFRTRRIIEFYGVTIDDSYMDLPQDKLAWWVRTTQEMYDGRQF